MSCVDTRKGRDILNDIDILIELAWECEALPSTILVDLGLLIERGRYSLDEGWPCWNGEDAANGY